MNDAPSFRMARIERLFHELRYEIERGMMDREIDEAIAFEFYVPVSQVIPDGVVYCQFRTRPCPRHMMGMDAVLPRLRLVKSDK